MIRVVSARPSTARNRELYLDALRTAAIVRVVTYHSFSLPWLSWVFPAMGMMFALAGGLMVRSLDRQPAKTVIKNRFRRLLPALWLFGAVWVTYMTIKGGSPTNWDDPDTGSHMPLWHLVYWVVPVFEPPGNQAGFDGIEVLWYLRTYLWLVALSPFLLKAFRKWPIPTLVAPLLIVVLQSFNIIPNENSGDLFGIGEVWALLSTLGTFAPCWMLGFAHRTGKLQKLSGAAVAGLSVAMAAVGAIWALTHDSGGYDLNGIPLAQALWSMAFILPLLRYAPDASWIGRTPFLGRFVALVNARAVTIYLWHNVLIDLSYPIEDKISAAVPALSGVAYNPITTYVIIWGLIAVAVVLFGWVEDVAARRSPRLFPVGPSAAERRAADAAAAEQKAGELADAPTVHSADQFPQFDRGGNTQPLPTQAGAAEYPEPAFAGGYGGGDGYENRFYASEHAEPHRDDRRNPPREYGASEHGGSGYGDAPRYGNGRPSYGNSPGYGNSSGYDNGPRYGDDPEYGHDRQYGNAPGYGNAREYGSPREYESRRDYESPREQGGRRPSGDYDEYGRPGPAPRPDGGRHGAADAGVYDGRSGGRHESEPYPQPRRSNHYPPEDRRYPDEQPPPTGRARV